MEPTRHQNTTGHNKTQNIATPRHATQTPPTNLPQPDARHNHIPLPQQNTTRHNTPQHTIQHNNYTTCRKATQNSNKRRWTMSHNKEHHNPTNNHTTPHNKTKYYTTQRNAMRQHTARHDRTPPDTRWHHPTPHCKTQNTPRHNTTTQPYDNTRPNTILRNTTQRHATKHSATRPTATFSSTTWHNPPRHDRTQRTTCVYPVCRSSFTWQTGRKAWNKGRIAKEAQRRVQQAPVQGKGRTQATPKPRPRPRARGMHPARPICSTHAHVTTRSMRHTHMQHLSAKVHGAQERPHTQHKHRT